MQIGNYILGEKLGNGGFSAVYLGRHIYTNRVYAIKVMEGKHADSLQIEAHRLRILSHDHILPFVDFGIEESHAYMVMPYMPDGDIATICQRGQRLSIEWVVYFTQQIAQAVDYAHTRGIIHRDLKPWNILRSDYHLYLADFGIAKRLTESGLEEIINGTPEYVSPDILLGNLHAGTDIYSLGIIVYEWLSGCVPFQGRTAIECCTQHLYATPPSIAHIVGDKINAVVQQALHKKPGLRYPSAGAFANALNIAMIVSEETRKVAVV